MNESDLYYLRSILGHLRGLKAIADKHGGPGLPGEALADNIDWLDCFIDKYERAQKKQKENFDAAMKQRRAQRSDFDAS